MKDINERVSFGVAYDIRVHTHTITFKDSEASLRPGTTKSG